MTADQKVMGFAFVCWGIALAYCAPGCSVTGCAASAEATYTGQQLSCVDRAKTREESKACRAEVDARWCVEDGAPGHCSEGGTR